MYDRQRRYERRKASEAADIGEIPAVVNPDRREACRLNLHLFLTTYFPASTGLKPFCEDQLAAIATIQQCAVDGGLYWQAFPRGFAKTTISENSAIWATGYAHRRFVPVFGADRKAANDNIESIKVELAENDLLYEDFPEICHPIRALENKPQRCASQTHTIWAGCEECGGSGKAIKEGTGPDPGPPREGKCDACGGSGKLGDPQLTYIAWTSDTIVLPTIRGSAASGAIVTARGIMGGCRGLKHKRPDGTQQRPDFVIIDDPQTDESAASEIQTKKRLSTIQKSVLKLGGHSKKMAVVINATVIRRQDLVEQLGDRKKFPAWRGKRIKMVRKWGAAHEKMWLGEYADLRNDFDPDDPEGQSKAQQAATAFYKRNRKRMDEGCEVTWEHCFDPDTEISAVQHAYNLLIDDGDEVFASECQNEPLDQRADNEAEILSAAQIAAKLNNLPRGQLPVEASHLVVFIDPKETLLYWVVAGFDDDFNGFVADYGTHPDQHKRYFAAKEARHTLAKGKGKDKSGLEAQVYEGLDDLVNQLMHRDYRRDDSAVLKPKQILIDANYGPLTDVIKKFCRHSKHAAVLAPSHGKYVGATGRPMREWAKKDGERVGLNWRIPPKVGRHEVRHVLFDTNYWKSFVHGRWATPMGGRGCLSLFGSDPKVHELFADHQVAEKAFEVEAKGRRVIEFKEKPHRPDNDYFDSIVGCYVAASMLGVSLKEMSGGAVARVRVRLSELQKARRGNATPATNAAEPATAPATQDVPAASPAGPRRVRLSELQQRKRTGGNG